MTTIKGILSAIFSVYDENRNVIDETVKQMVEYQIKGGLDGFYVCGNTGECTVLPEKTRMQMLQSVIDANKGRKKVIAHVGAGHIDEVYNLIDHANEVGVDAIASLPPSLTSYYGMDEVIEYYKIIAKRSKAPVFAYITSVLKGNLVEFAKSVAEIDNILGLKISIGDYFAFGQVKAIKDGKMNVLNGPDETMICGLIEGADGAIGTTYNILPKLSKGIYEDFNNKNLDAALDKQRKMNNVINILIGHNNAYWKAAMTILGFNMGCTIEPGKQVDEEQIKLLKEKLEKVNFFDLI